MSSVHFKFRSSLEYEPLFFDGHCISLKDLRESIIAKKKLGKASDFKLEVTDSTTEKEYINDNDMIPKNASLIVRRVPIFYEKPKETPVVPFTIDPVELAEIGNIAKISAPEEAKLKAIMIQSDQFTDNHEYFLFFYFCEAESALTSQRVPICFHCKKIGHVIKNCPLIPRQSSLGKEPVHFYLKSALGIPIEPPKTRQIEQSSEATKELPDFFRCPLCSSALENALLIPCCGSSFCDHCIQNYLIDNESICPSCQATMTPEDLVPNISLRKSLNQFMTGHISGIKPPSTSHQSPHFDPPPPSVVSSQALTSVNIKPNINNSLLSSLNLQGLTFSGSILENLKPLLHNATTKLAPELVSVTAPFITSQYARSVVLGKRILTRDEFYSLKSTLSRELRIKNKSDHKYTGKRHSSSSRSRKDDKYVKKSRDSRVPSSRRLRSSYSRERDNYKYSQRASRRSSSRSPRFHVKESRSGRRHYNRESRRRS